jgi:hypothetical protein
MPGEKDAKEDFDAQFRAAVVGQRVCAIGFPYRSSFAITLDNGAGFIIHSRTQIANDGWSLVAFETGFRARLCELLGESVSDLDNRADECALRFSNGLQLIFSNRPDDFQGGPEGGIFRYDDLWVVWNGN